MTENIIIIIITSLTTIFVKWLTEVYPKQPSKKEQYITRTKHYLGLEKIAYNLRKELSAAGIYVGKFHNGGTFITGIPMDKFTVVAEDYIEDVESYKRIYSNCLTTSRTYSFNRLLKSNRHYIDSVKKDGRVDISYKDDLIKRNINSAYMFLINDPVKDVPLGFISIEYFFENGFKEEQEPIIWKHQNEIANLLNMNIKMK